MSLWCSDVIVFPYSDHDCVYLEVIKDLSHSNELGSKVVISRPIDEQKLFSYKRALLNENWEQLYLNCNFASADKTFETFFNICITNFDMFIPKRKCTVKSSFKSNKLKKNTKKHRNEWYTTKLADKKNKVMTYLYIYRIHKTELAKSFYVKAKKDYQHAINRAKYSYNVGKIEKSKNKCKSAWKVINSVAKNKSKEVVSVTPDEFNNFCIQSVDDIASNISKPVESFSYFLNKSQNSLPPDRPEFVFKEVTQTIVLDIVNKLTPSNSVDIYDFSCNLLKQIIHSVIEPLTYCINKCVKEGEFPNILKLSRVVPIFKKV